MKFPFEVVPVLFKPRIQVFNPSWTCDRCLRNTQRSSFSHNVLSTYSFLTGAPRRRPAHAILRPSIAACYSRSSYSIDKTNGSSNAREKLPSLKERERSQLSKRFSNLMDHMQSNIFIAGQRLNALTGYSGIEALKKEIEDQGKLHPTAH